MIFSEKSIEGLLSGSKTQTRRLVKEKDFIEAIDITKKVKLSGRIKWQVGRDYAVQTGRGKKGLMINYVSGFVKEFEDVRGSEMDTSKPLRVVVTGIRKEKLLDISLEDAKREGYDSVDSFGKAFCDLNKIEYVRITINNVVEVRPTSNPFVWVLDLKIKE
jgi:hypothetical protein